MKFLNEIPADAKQVHKGKCEKNIERFLKSEFPFAELDAKKYDHASSCAASYRSCLLYTSRCV